MGQGMNSGGPRRLASRWAALLFMVMTFGACLPAAMAAEIESLSLDNGEYRIPGTLTLPGRLQVASSCPAVLMLHGTGSNKDEVGGVYKRLAGELARQPLVDAADLILVRSGAVQHQHRWTA